MGWKTTSDQSNGDSTGKYGDMRIGVIPRGKVDSGYLAKLEAEYAKLSPKQKQSFWRTNSISSS
tara:strand:- start:984 stop:1175 length:192 start_codon:yes stop_codon:yes gene_type:complete